MRKFELLLLLLNLLQRGLINGRPTFFMQKSPASRIRIGTWAADAGGCVLFWNCKGQRERSPSYQKLCTPSNHDLWMWRASTSRCAMRGLSSGEPPYWSRHTPVPGKYENGTADTTPDSKHLSEFMVAIFWKGNCIIFSCGKTFTNKSTNLTFSTPYLMQSLRVSALFCSNSTLI